MGPRRVRDGVDMRVVTRTGAQSWAVALIIDDIIIAAID
jgi:hypothetical protein